jgi:Domain of unknown function (DUF5666)
MMKRMAKRMTIALTAAILALPMAYAQEGDGPPDGGDAMGRVFGRGNGVRGTVTAAGADNFTIRTDEGDTYKVLFSANTRLMKDRQPIEANEIHVGDMLVAGGIVDAKAKTVGAVVLFDVDAAKVREAKAGFGKTWVMGKVTGIHELKITIERSGDKQAQVIGVDENTSFRKRREDVTLADVKVGDFISCQGALHQDLFMATSLRVMTPVQGGGPGRLPGGPPAAPVQ